MTSSLLPVYAGVNDEQLYDHYKESWSVVLYKNYFSCKIFNTRFLVSCFWLISSVLPHFLVIALHWLYLLSPYLSGCKGCVRRRHWCWVLVWYDVWANCGGDFCVTLLLRQTLWHEYILCIYNRWKYWDVHERAICSQVNFVLCCVGEFVTKVW